MGQPWVSQTLFQTGLLNHGHLISQQYVVLRWTNAEIPERQTHRWVTRWAVSLQCLQWAAADLHGAREGEPQAYPEPM